MNKVLKECSLCQSTAELKYKDFPGYQEGLKYDIYECSNCEASFIDPLKSDESIYNSMYKESEYLVGYERYNRYSKLVKKFSKPLEFLATTEPPYWSVISEIKKDTRAPKDIKILEIGSGLGYLTYSLRKSGYNSSGIDISNTAVLNAVENYGEYFKVADLFELHHQSERYDYVLMMDVIEHVESPKSFTKAALNLLADGGKLLITTPNKSSAPINVSLWQSDAPPVHLWFLSEKSLSTISQQISATCCFVDFSKYNSKFYSPQYSDSIDKIKLGLPRLNVDGSINQRGFVGQNKSKFLGLKLRYILSYIRRRLHKKERNVRSTIVCAVLSKS